MCSGSIVQYSPCIDCDSGRVSGPSDNGSRSTSGDTGEGELRVGSIEVRVHSQCHTTWDGYISYKENSIIYINEKIRQVNAPKQPVIFKQIGWDSNP